MGHLFREKLKLVTRCVPNQIQIVDVEGDLSTHRFQRTVRYDTNQIECVSRRGERVLRQIDLWRLDLIKRRLMSKQQVQF